MSRRDFVVYKVHYIIGGFAVLTLVAAAYLRQEVVKVHDVTLIATRRWTELERRVEDLQVGIARIDAAVEASVRGGTTPADGVGVAVQRAIGQFHAVERAAGAVSSAPLDPLLATVDRGLRGLVAAQEDVASRGAEVDASSSERLTGELRRRLAIIGQTLTVLHQAVDDLQSADLRRQEAVAASISGREWITLALIGATLVMVAGFARTMSHAARAVSRERELFIRELEEDKRALGEALLERDAALGRLRQQQTLLNHAERIAHVGSWRRDLADGELTVSDELARILGLEDGRALTRSVYVERIHPEDRARVEEAIGAAITAQTPFKLEYRIVRDDGAEIAVYSEGDVETAEDKPVLTVVVQDITERREVERMKDQFISTVSHELRTPLTSIRGSLGLLTSGRLGTLSGKGQRMLEIASANTDRLVRLINDILDIERMRSGRASLTRSRCDAAGLVASAIDAVRALADAEEIRIESEADPVWFSADADRVVQVLTNLIGNAVKFSPARSVVRVGAVRRDRTVVFTVADQGRGIPQDQLENVFEPFRQVDATDSRERGGTGLGLAICRSIVRQHGGEIGVDSNPGRGSTFTFTIPGAEPDATEETDVGSRRIFVCDDDADTRAVLREHLVARGYSVRTVSSGADLLTAVADEVPDAIVLDLFMPGLNGWETLARLKSSETSARIPVIIASVSSPDEVEAPPEGSAQWLQKPFDGDALAAALESVCRGRHRAPRLMLVEDDRDLARVIAAGLEKHGVDIVYATAGARVLELAREITPDLIVLDLVLPGLDGFGVVEWLKDHDLWRSVPMVVYSATEPTPSQRERLQLGPTEFLVKSRISPEEFETRVVRLLDALTGPALEATA